MKTALHFNTGRLFAQNESLEILVAETWFHFYGAWKDWATKQKKETGKNPSFKIEKRDCSQFGYKQPLPCLCLYAGNFSLAMAAFPDSWIDEVDAAFKIRLETLFEMGWRIETERKAA